MKTIAIIAAYNEDEVLLQSIINFANNYVDEVLIIDDASNLKLKLANCILFRNLNNKGKGYSLRRGFEYAIFNKFDIIITMDADGEHDPKDIPILLKPFLLNNFKGQIVGKRKKFRSVFRTLLNFWCNFWMRFIIKEINDFASGFRSIDIESLKKLKLESNDFDIDLEITLETAKNRIKNKSVTVSSVIKTNRKSFVKVKNYLLMNNFFDYWVLRNINKLKFSFIKRFILIIACIIGLMCGKILLIFF